MNVHDRKIEEIEVVLYSQQEAIAQLIAAAPDLLKMLERLAVLFEQSIITNSRIRFKEDILWEIKNVIGKAKGEIIRSGEKVKNG